MDKLTDALARLASPASGGHNKRGDQLKELAKQMHAARKAGDPQKLAEVATAIDKVAGSGKDATSRELRKIAEEARKLADAQGFSQVRRELGLTRNTFARMSSDGKFSIKEDSARGSRRTRSGSRRSSAATRRRAAKHWPTISGRPGSRSGRGCVRSAGT